MLKRIRTHILDFLGSSVNPPFIIGISAGLYPFLKYYNSNFPLINSVKHLIIFGLLFLVAPLFLSYLIKRLGKKLNGLKKHETLLLSVVNFGFFAFLIVISTWGLKNKYIFIALLTALVFAFLLKKHLKKVIVFQLIMALMVIPKLIPELYKQFFTTDDWKVLKDSIESVKLQEKPNIYLVQPDGYVNKKTMENGLYRSRSPLYDWLELNEFKVYNDFRSNYPTTLVSNSSMFTMKHHYFGTTFSSIEMTRARETINGDNSVIEILKNNGYINYFIVEDVYFQFNFPKSEYDYQNISHKDISYFWKEDGIARDVYKDLENVLEQKFIKENPRFFFIEKTIPHHVLFEKPLEVERKEYLKKIKEANNWIKKIVNLINKKDPNALIIIIADHGGWVGIDSLKSFFTTRNHILVNSIYSNLCAIKWNGVDGSEYDKNLKTNVNLFRVLFSALSKNSNYLNYLEVDDSYQMKKNSFFEHSIFKLINENGDVVEEKLKK